MFLLDYGLMSSVTETTTMTVVSVSTSCWVVGVALVETYWRMSSGQGLLADRSFTRYLARGDIGEKHFSDSISGFVAGGVTMAIAAILYCLVLGLKCR